MGARFVEGSGNAKRAGKALGALCFALVTLGASSAGATNSVTYCDFSNQTQISTELQVNGDAVASGSQLHLTPNSGNKSGSIFFKSAFPWTANTSFHTHFRFRIYPNADATGGEGITFMLQNKKVTSVGGSGGGLGYNGVTNSVAVEFDTVQNSGDPSGNYVGLLADGNLNTHLASAAAPMNLKGGSTLDAWIDYDGPTDALAVYLATSPSSKPASPLLTATVDIFAHVGAQAFIGFSGATSGGATDNQDVDYWVFNGTDVSPTDCLPCSTDADCASTPLTPACEPNHFCGQCSSTNNSACVGTPTPVCIVAVGECGGCNSNTDCSGNTPICNLGSHLCGPCTGDSDCTNPAFPACQTTGPLAGSCTECGTNPAQCSGSTPVCLTGVGTCGCTDNGQCPANTLCLGQPPTCQNGCIVGQKDCQNGLVCSVQDGGTGVCTNPATGCTGNGDCTVDPLRVCANPGPSGTCVQCTQTADCTGSRVCDTTNNTCVECTPGSTGNCSSQGSGPTCLPGDVCGCQTDGDCGGLTSGRVCDDTQHVCIAGCRGLGGNTCPLGLVCSSQDTTIGSCGSLVGDGGTPDGGGLDGSAGDAGKDGGAKDGSTDGAADDGAVNDGAASDGSFHDGSSGGDGAAGNDSGENSGNGTSVEGGGCSCSTAGGGEGAPFGALFALGGALALWGGRRRRRG